MAYDKVVDSAQLESAITATADAIREKTGDTEKIEWLAEKGFADAVGAIEAGSGGGQYAWEKFDTSGNLLGYVVSDNAEEYPENGTAEDGFVYEKIDYLFSFYVTDDYTGEVATYYATDGMTWGEWVDSEYNTAGYYKSSYYYADGYYYVISNYDTSVREKIGDEMGVDVSAHQIIIPNFNYRTDSDD